ncbi:MAG: hypothetical protein SF052_05680 [Bacteroidia bacterium]|nr:hypothetical protein [Bacteroidia bacterium]
MAESRLPLYGRFIFPSVETFVQRIREVSSSYMGGASFNAYITTYEGTSFYGLDYTELETIFKTTDETIRTLSASCSGPQGKSVSINVRFAKSSEPGEGQFVIVAGTKYLNNLLSEILRGEYVSPSDEAIEKQILLEEFIRDLLLIKKRQAQKEKERERESLRPTLSPTPTQNVVSANEQPINTGNFKTLRDSFFLDQEISVSVLVQLLEELSVRFLTRAPFNIRVITLDGESYSDIGIKGLRRFFEMRRRVIKRVYMDAATQEGELVDILLVLDPDQRPSIKAEITTGTNREIREVIRKTLLLTLDFTAPTSRASMVHEMFRFSQPDFSLDKVIRLITIISTKYLQKEAPTAFLSSLQGETYPALNLRQLKTVYNQHHPNVSFLLFGMNQALTGQTFSLMFQFQSPGHEPYGSLSMMWGEHETHQIVRALIWEQLSLTSYRPEEQPPAGIPETLPVSRKSRELRVNPVFNKREFKAKPRTCMIAMPLEAYWSEALWAHLNHTMKSLGYDSIRAEALFSENVLEDTWTTLNEVDLVIADLTYKHPDVFYKAGIAHTLGKKVIILSQHARDVPKDFFRFPVIVYDNNINGLDTLSRQFEVLVKPD